MSRIIKLTDDVIQNAVSEFEAAMRQTKMADGKFTYNKTFGTLPDKATLTFTEKAYWKMTTLVKEWDKEIGWHGVARRGDGDIQNEYIVSDIVVYPQRVTATNVNPDQVEYQTWLMQQDDEVFNNIRMQGHSHVNMAVTPSGVDLALYDKILDQLEDDMFYIFLIWNKRNEKTIKIYDMAKNILFETADITVRVIEDGTGMSVFLEDAKKKVKDMVYAPQTSASKQTTQPATQQVRQTTANGTVKSTNNNAASSGKGFGTNNQKSKAKDDYYYDDYYDDYYGGYYGWNSPRKSGGKW